MLPISPKLGLPGMLAEAHSLDIDRVIWITGLSEARLQMYLY
jgi:hypothetical protein